MPEGLLFVRWTVLYLKATIVFAMVNVVIRSAFRTAGVQTIGMKKPGIVS